jgi:ketosteroid isomerase-like protein
MTGTTIGLLSSADHAAIRASTDRFPTSLVKRDFAALGRLYTEDAVVMPPNQPAVFGRAAFERWIVSFPRVLRLTLTPAEIDGRADIAYVRGTYAMTLHPEGAPTPVDDVGKYVEIRKRQPDGSWLIATDIFNSDKS